MKTKKKIFLSLILIFMMFFTTNVFAYELACDAGEYKFGDIFYCDLKGNGGMYNYLSGTIDENDFVSCELNQTSGTSGITNKTFYVSGNLSNPILKLKCNVTGKPTIDTNEILKISDFEYETNGFVDNEIIRSNAILIKKYEDESKKEEEKPRDTTNSNSLLKSLILKDQDGNELDLQFSKFVTQYQMKVLFDVNSVILDPLAFNPDATVEIKGDTKLKVNKTSVIDIYITSPDNETKTCYTLYITRLARGEEIYYPEKDASLQGLFVTDYQFDKDFESEVYEYEIHVPSKVDNVEVHATSKVDGANIDISDTTITKSVTVISIKVTSKNGSTTNEYRITVYRSAAKADYTSVWIMIGILAIILAAIVMFVRSSQKKYSDDPVDKLGRKEKKKRLSKFNLNNVPDAEPTSTDADIEGLKNVTKAQDNVNVIEVAPTGEDPLDYFDDGSKDNNRNKITRAESTLVLNPQNNLAIPVAVQTVQQPVVQPQVVQQVDGIQMPRLANDVMQPQVVQQFMQPQVVQPQMITPEMVVPVQPVEQISKPVQQVPVQPAQPVMPQNVPIQTVVQQPQSPVQSNVVIPNILPGQVIPGTENNQNQ